ncbi:MAG: hypothetical protein ACE5JR_01350 [Gemmatimonadota bacterium]
MVRRSELAFAVVWFGLARVPASARAQESTAVLPAIDEGSVATVPVVLPEALLEDGGADATDHVIRFSVEPAGGVRLLGAPAGAFTWRDGDPPFFPLTFMVPRRFPAGPFLAARVLFRGGTGREARIEVRARTRRRRDVRLELRPIDASLHPGGTARLRYVLTNRGNAEDTVRLAATGPALDAFDLPDTVIVPPGHPAAGEFRVRARRRAAPGSTALVRLEATDREPRVMATANLTVVRDPGWLPHLVHLPATVFLGGSVVPGYGSGGGGAVLNVQSAGRIGSRSSLRFSYRKTPEDGGSPIFAGAAFGPRLQVGMEHGALGLTAGDVVASTGHVFGRQHPGSGIEARWRGERLSVVAVAARPRGPRGGLSGTLGSAVVDYGTPFGNVGFEFDYQERPGGPDGRGTRVGGGVIRYTWEGAGAHRVAAEAGPMWVADADGATAGLAADLRYAYAGLRAGLDVRGRTLPATAAGARLPPRELRAAGWTGLWRGLSAVGSAFAERDPPTPGARTTPAATEGLEAGFRLTTGESHLDLTGILRRSESFPELGALPSTRRTLRGGFGMLLGPFRIDGSMELGASRRGERRGPARTYRGGIAWLGERGRVRLGGSFAEDIETPRSGQAELSGAWRIVGPLEFRVGAAAVLDGGDLWPDLTAWGAARLDLGRRTTLYLGAESRAPLATAEARGSRWRFSLGVRRQLPVPLPLRRRPAAEGIVFEDRNGNGRREPGEPPVSGALIRLGGEHEKTGADGRFVFAPNDGSSSLWVDPASLPPGRLPARSFFPPSGLVEIPVIRTASLTLRLFLDGNGNGRRDEGEGPAPEVTVHIGDEAAGSWVVRSAADGDVRLSAIRPGHYIVRVGGESLPPRATPPEELGLQVVGGESLVVEVPIRTAPRAVRFSEGSSLEAWD